jgi:hypothetical protein
MIICLEPERPQGKEMWQLSVEDDVGIETGEGRAKACGGGKGRRTDKD